MNFDKEYWESKYESEQTGWDVGYIATPIKEYIDQLNDKSIKILVPGAGNAYEAEYLYKNGFYNTFIIEYASKPIENFLKRIPDFPRKNILKEDFFTHQNHYDLIIEHTFFSSIHPNRRATYVQKTHDLLKEKGKLIGLLFCINFNSNKPPFGGDIATYKKLFNPYFNIKLIETSYNSIKPRENNELFIIFEKNTEHG